MAIHTGQPNKYLRDSVLQKLEKHNLSIRMFPYFDREILENAICYTICTRLCPLWNKVGNYLVNGRDFLCKRKELSFVDLMVNVGEDRLHFTLRGFTGDIPVVQVKTIVIMTKSQFSDIGIPANLHKAFTNYEINQIPSTFIMPAKLNVLPRRSQSFTYPSCCLTLLNQNLEFPRKFKDDGTVAVEQFLNDLRRLVPRILNSDFTRTDTIKLIETNCPNFKMSLRMGSPASKHLSVIRERKTPTHLISIEGRKQMSEHQKHSRPGPNTQVKEPRREDNDYYLATIHSMTENINHLCDLDLSEEYSSTRVDPTKNSPEQYAKKTEKNTSEKNEELINSKCMRVPLQQISEKSVNMGNDDKKNSKPTGLARNALGSRTVRGVKRGFYAPRSLLDCKENENRHEMQEVPQSSGELILQNTGQNLIQWGSRSAIRVGMSKKRKASLDVF
ncbi:hypothetical protein FGIG_02211 [Fasciola gigantica]|uniref:DUF4708 domain-containing protein n=1 Tax=Fasciola gigantica TaxID=46835 RepID=A0A504Z3Z2_FASGI|nr:hypothetical protein FGIG_02211 [Fasciola gigantica]